MKYFFRNSYYNYSLVKIFFKLYNFIFKWIRFIRIFACVIIWYYILEVDDEITNVEYFTNASIILSLI